MTKTIALVIYLLALTQVNACINEYVTTLKGEVTFTEGYGWKLERKEIDTVKLSLKANSLFASYKRSDSLEYYSDYGAVLIYLGDYQKAKNVYEGIEKMSPNLYTTASNLGTIYELIGKPDSALFWIKKSMELNSESHFGSEWIHVKLLEFKISGSQNLSQSLLGLDFGNGKIPVNRHKYDLKRLQRHLWHQLEERTKLVPPKDQIVGNLYFDMGNILAQVHSVEAALACYDAAKEYGFESKLMDSRIEAFEKLADRADSYRAREKMKRFVGDHFLAVFLFLSVSGIGVSYLVFRLLRRRKRKKG